MPLSDIIGRFTWNELGTRDREAAKAFYGALFGWEFLDESMGELGTYTIIMHAGQDVGGMYELDGPRFEGVPPHWMGYVHVEDCDASAARAAELGGTVCMPPMDIKDIGRMAVVMDPDGAAFAVFQDTAGEAERQGGFPDDMQHGMFCWNELACRDADRTRAFYGGLFGWSAETQDMGHAVYTRFSRDGRPVAGMMPMTAEWGDTPPHWMTYVRVDDVDAVAKRAAEHGGQVCVPPQDIGPAGRFSVLTDPSGAVFSVISRPPG